MSLTFYKFIVKCYYDDLYDFLKELNNQKSFHVVCFKFFF